MNFSILQTLVDFRFGEILEVLRLGEAAAAVSLLSLTESFIHTHTHTRGLAH